MPYWLIKSEPSAWSWSQQVKAGKTHWDGVRNYQAANNLKAMKIGDRAFFYHSNEGREIVGIVEITGEAKPDPKDASGRFVMVEVKALKPLATPVTLDRIKREEPLANMALLKQSRLSVQPVTREEWDYICRLGNA